MNFEKRFQELDFLSDREDAIDEFTHECELLYLDIRALPGQRYDLLMRLKILQRKQAVFLMSLLEKARLTEGIADAQNSAGN